MKKTIIGVGVALLLLTGCGTAETQSIEGADVNADTVNYDDDVETVNYDDTDDDKQRQDRLNNMIAEQENNPNTMSTTVYDKSVETWSNAMTEGLENIVYYAEMGAYGDTDYYTNEMVRTMEYLSSYIDNFQNIRIGEDYPAERTEVHLHVTSANLSYTLAFENYTGGIINQDPELIDQGDFFLALAEESLNKALLSYE